MLINKSKHLVISYMYPSMVVARLVCTVAAMKLKCIYTREFETHL